MGSKNKRKRESGGEGKGSDEVNQMISDPRFSSAHTDPRFRTIPRRQTKVAIDSRFQGVLTDKASAPVDKRGRRRRKGMGKDSLKEFYRIDEDDDDKKKKIKQKVDGEDEDKSEESEEEESMSEKKLGLKLDEKSESNEETESGEEEEEEEDSEEVSMEEDTDEDDEAISEDDGPEIPEEIIPIIEEETHRLAIVNLDWRHFSANDLYVVLNSLIPKDGRLLSVTVYPTEFGLERMKEEEIHGPAIEGRRKKEDDDNDEDEEDEEDEESEEEEEEEDEDVINEKLRDYEKSKLGYYFAVAEFDSVATADHLYTSYDGFEIERSSNKLDLRFIPDSIEFNHPPRDIATEAPSDYKALDFQSRALQMSKVDISWDEDDPRRVKTLNQRFKPDQLAELELKEYLASSDESESDEDNNEEGINRSKKKRKIEKYRALCESGDVNSDKDDEEENGQNMEVTFNTGLEDLPRKLEEKKERESETVWQAHLRKGREKKKARKNKLNDDDSSSSPDDDDDNVDRKVVKGDGDDDFFMEQPVLKKKDKKKKKKGLEEDVAAAEEKSRAELELLLADENAGDGGKALKGYNIKRKGKRQSKEMAEEKIPAANLEDPRFSALFSDPRYALDPTDPNFKRSAAYVRQVAQKQKKDPISREEVKPTEEMEVKPDGKKERHEMNSTVKSLKMKMKAKGSEKKNAGNAGASSTMAQRVKKKANAISYK